MQHSPHWVRPDAGRSVTLAVRALLLALSAYAIVYELGCTLIPAISRSVPFIGLGPDVVMVIAALLVIRRGIGAERGWTLIGIGILFWAAGDVYWTLALSTVVAPPVPSLADAGYLLFGPFAAAGILFLVHQRGAAPRRTLVVDALGAALAVAALSAAVVIVPVFKSADGGAIPVGTNLAYPLTGLLLLGLIVGATALGNWRFDRSWLLLAISVLVFCVADGCYLVTAAAGTYQPTSWFNPLWYGAPVLAAWAAWSPRRGGIQVGERPSSARGIVMPLSFALGALTILVWSSFHRLGLFPIVLATTSLLVMMFRLVLTWRENATMLEASLGEAMTDALTGLGNRRALNADLQRRLSGLHEDDRFLLVLFDLDGFKHYNDTFGHPAGDALLRRLGANLGAHLKTSGTAYRMGGDEFCALIDGFAVRRISDVSKAAAAALSEHGDEFSIRCSYGAIVVPHEAQTINGALRLADQRMYAGKRVNRVTISLQSKDVLLRALAERSPDMGSHHVHEIVALASATAERFSLSGQDVEQIRHAAELHDVGKVAIPDAIPGKPAALDELEWGFIRRHTLIGERILAAAPDLRLVATLVRSSHENFDGSGYPDELRGQQIPLGSRIIAVADAFDAMTTYRPYREVLSEEAALTELRDCAGSQFDPEVVEVFCEVVLSRRRVGQLAR